MWEGERGMRDVGCGMWDEGCGKGKGKGKRKGVLKRMKDEGKREYWHST